jgi:type III secretion protein J
MLRAALLLVLVAGCETVVESDLTEAQANEVVVALHARGIGARKERVEAAGDEARFQVRVADDDVAGALAALRASEVPSRPDPGLAEVFGEGSLVPTATEERARYAAALSGELARSIERIDGVLDARVHVAIPDARRFALTEEQPRPRASVLVRYRGRSPPYRPEQVQAIVAGAVDGMRAEDVAVVGVAAAAPPEASAALVHVGPIAVARGSAGALKGVLGGALALHVLLALCLVFVVLRKRRAEPPPPG